MQNLEKCVAPGCKKRVRCRGLCNKHYAEAYYEVSVKKSTTWRKLETHKPPLARPKAKTRNGSSKFRKAVIATK